MKTLKLLAIALSLAAVLILLAPRAASAQGFECPACVLGIYDDPDLSRNFGFWNPASDSLKSIWVGVTYDLAIPQLNGLVGVELSASGLIDPFRDPVFVGIPEPAVVIGQTISTPSDSLGAGGVNIAWNSCLPNDRAVIRIDLVSQPPVANDIALRVLPRFPPLNPTLPFPLFLQCQGPWPAVRVAGGCYVINPTVGPGDTVDGCTLTETVAVETSTWSAVKSLYRDD